MGRKMGRRNFGYWVLVSSLGVALSACSIGGSPTAKGTPATSGVSSSNAGGNAGASNGNILMVREDEQGTSLDPMRTADIHDWGVMLQIYDPLILFKPGTSNFEPGLATKWNVSKDGTVYTLQLRKGVQFQKGFGKMTSADVVFSIKRLMSAQSVWRTQFSMIKNVVAVGPYEVKIVLKHRFTPFIWDLTNARPLSGLVVSKKAVEKYGKAYGQNPVGTGPFQLQKFTPYQSTLLVANKHYWGGAPKLAGVDFKVVKSDSSAALALRSGELDVADLSNPTVISQLKKDPKLEIVTGKRWELTFLMMNELVKPLNNVLVREAIAHAINYQAIRNVAFGGYAQTPGCGLIKKGMPGYAPDISKPWTYNPTLSRQLLKQAGVRTPLKLGGVSYNTPNIENEFKLVTSQLQAVGIDVTFQYLPRAAVVVARAKKTNPLTVVAWTTVRDPDIWLNALSSGAIPPRGTNFARYHGADRLIAESRSTAGAQRDQVLRQVQQQFCKDVPAVGTSYEDFVFAIQKSSVKNFQVTGPEGEWFYPVTKAR